MSDGRESAKPASQRDPSMLGEVDPEADEHENLNMQQVEYLLYQVQKEQESAVRGLAKLIREKVDAEADWKQHQSRQMILIRDRISRGSGEKSSQDLREAEILQSLDEEGTKGITLWRRYNLLEERVKQGDRYCRTLEKRGSILQTLAANLRDVT